MNKFNYQGIDFEFVPIGYGQLEDICKDCYFDGKGCIGLRASKQIPECWIKQNDNVESFIFKTMRK